MSKTRASDSEARVATPEDESGLTITQLAHRVGMTVRNVRAHQSRGLLPPPERRGRRVVYDESHERRLRQIRDLQARGFNLTAIALMLDEGRDRPTPMQQTVLAPLLDVDEVVLTWSDMVEMFNLTPSRRRLEQALEQELLRDLGDGRYAAPSGRLLEATKALAASGMSVLDIYAMQLEMMGATRSVARRFVEACLRSALAPYAEAGPSPEQWSDVQVRFEELRTLTTAVLASTFSVNVRRATVAILAEHEGVTT